MGRLLSSARSDGTMFEPRSGGPISLESWPRLGQRNTGWFRGTSGRTLPACSSGRIGQPSPKRPRICASSMPSAAMTDRRIGPPGASPASDDQPADMSADSRRAGAVDGLARSSGDDRGQISTALSRAQPGRRKMRLLFAGTCRCECTTSARSTALETWGVGPGRRGNSPGCGSRWGPTTLLPPVRGAVTGRRSRGRP